MPKKAEHVIAWSNTLQGYELHHGSLSSPLTIPSSLQFWLDFLCTIHFCAASGDTLTLRKEVKQRGNGYWYAYKRVSGKVLKKYIGESSKVTLAMLEEIAYRFTHPAVNEPPPPPPPPPRTPTLKFDKSLPSALAIYGFSYIPGKKVLINRYRELSKQYHPDVGGLHEDMVALNLSFEYLRRFV